MHRRFGAYLPTQVFCALPRTAEDEAALDAALARHRHELAAVIVEPLVQGAGGMLTHPPEVLATIARLARRHGLPLIADEIFTGFGRTGTLFACEQAGIVPDILCLSKALTGGTMALAATVATTEIFSAFWSDEASAALMHGPTFMANPLACAAANASLDLFEAEPRLAQAQAIAARLQEGLAPLSRLCRCGGRFGCSAPSARCNSQARPSSRISSGVSSSAASGCARSATSSTSPGAHHRCGRSRPSDRGSDGGDRGGG